MNCQNFRQQLDAALDEQRVVSRQNGSAADADTVAHAESCSNCRSLYEEHVLIEAALSAWKPRRQNVDLVARIMEAVREEDLISSKESDLSLHAVGTSERTRRGGTKHVPVVDIENSSKSPARRSFWPTVVTVALVLVAVVLVFREKTDRLARDERPPQQLFPARQPEQLNEPQDQLADIGHLVADARSAWQGITRRVSRQTSGFSVFVPDLKNELGVSDISESFDIVPRESTSDSDSDSSRPSAVEKAFEFLFDDPHARGSQTI